MKNAFFLGLMVCLLVLVGVVISPASFANEQPLTENPEELTAFSALEKLWIDGVTSEWSYYLNPLPTTVPYSTSHQLYIYRGTLEVIRTEMNGWTLYRYHYGGYIYNSGVMSG